MGIKFETYENAEHNVLVCIETTCPHCKTPVRFATRDDERAVQFLEARMKHLEKNLVDTRAALYEEKRTNQYLKTLLAQ